MPLSDKKINIIWLRRDLRLHDNAALYHALKDAQKHETSVLPLFIFDKTILDALANKHDRRVQFIHHSLQNLQQELEKLGSTLLVKYGEPIAVWNEILQSYKVATVFANHDYEPYAIKRDANVRELLASQQLEFKTYKDQCVFEKDEVLKPDGKPYTVFTPYSKRWRAKMSNFYQKKYSCDIYITHLLLTAPLPLPELSSMGFELTSTDFPKALFDTDIVQNYAAKRDFPAQRGTSRLSLHLRFGTISVRELLRYAGPLSETFVNELIWRDFYMMILWHFPHVEKRAFKPAYDRIRWRDATHDFERWCQGQTGYPLVDAGMRELNATGFMHNRVRMVVASFLTKHLLLDWRLGEAYFAEKLLDFDLSANNGGWQWAAGSGCDAAPYFRIFNPMSQAEKFDPKMSYIKKWVPEILQGNYGKPIVEHTFARERCLKAYKEALGAYTDPNV